MFETMKRIYKKTKDVSLLEKAVKKEWITEEEKKEIMTEQRFLGIKKSIFEKRWGRGTFFRAVWECNCWKSSDNHYCRLVPVEVLFKGFRVFPG